MIVMLFLWSSINHKIINIWNSLKLLNLIKRGNRELMDLKIKKPYPQKGEEGYK
jgi:hypothetical protein